MKQVYLIVLLLALAISTSAQNQGTIKGRIINKQGEALPGISVGLEGTSYGAPTTESGYYNIKNVPTGNYKLIVSAIGFQSITRNINISGAKTITRNFTLREKSEELDEVVISGKREENYTTDVSSLASKTDIPLKDVPQAVSYVTKDLIQDQKAFLITDLVKNISGVNQESISGDYMIRGFGASRYIMINGVKVSKGWMPTLISNMERIEVIKGANSALYGYSDPGGTINRVTKKPLAESIQGINFSVGSYNTIRTEADLTGPLNEDKTILYRLNVAYQDAGSFRDLMGRKDVLLAPSVSFVPNQKTRVDLDVIYSKIQARVDRGQPFTNETDGLGRLNSTPNSLSATYSNSYNHEESFSLLGAISHKFTDNVQFKTSFISNQYSRDYLEHRTNNAYGINGTGNEIPTVMQMRLQRGVSTNTNSNVMSYFNFGLQTGRVKHNIVAGYDFSQELTPVGGWDKRLAGAYRNATNTAALNSYDPSKSELYLLDSDGSPVPNMPYFDLLNPDYTPQDIDDYFTSTRSRAASRYYTSGVYIQDQMKMGKLQLLIGLRQEFYTDFENYKEEDVKTVEQTAFIPRIGAVYSLTPNVNLYGTYVEGFQPQSAGVIGDPAIYGGPFDSLTSNMLEFGTKTEWFNKGLTVSASMYQIELNNILINANDPDNPELLKQRGQEVSKGLELDINGRILPNLSITANYSYNEALITKSDDPDLVNTRKEYAPMQMGGTWIKYNFVKGLLNGAGIALGSNFVSKQETGSNFTLPDYTVFDAALFYSIDNIKLSLNVNNLTDMSYWIGRGRAGAGISANPGTPRNFLFSVGYTF
ncbi:TonB-dependent receptor [Fulvivirga lutimaris]|uniref:TonB-dependent receptor n=1 Tax=Fulvivirga lutimaris TaxID=1819566 RepID=UPI0012BBF17E|nr:TonB-dependent receptor [Fulvivirga lutimaris]MTI41206.1 TonB-dependent receptor [Fulvivirga lutimaris]